MNTFSPGKLKAVYLLWLFLNLMLLVLSPSPFGKMKTSYSGRIDYAAGRRYGSFYPLISAHDYNGKESGLFFDHIEQFDITEFAFYSLAPLVLWKAARLWRSSDNKE